MSPRKNTNKYANVPRSLQSYGFQSKPDSMITLELSPGHTTVLNFNFLNDRPQIKQVFLQYFRLIGASVAPISNTTIYSAIRKFISFLNEYENKNDREFRTTSDLDPQVMLNFRMWLETRAKLRGHGDLVREKSAQKTAATIYNNVVLLLRRLRRYRPDWFPLLAHDLPRMRTSPHSTTTSSDVLSMKDLKKILKVAIYDNDQVRARHAEIMEVLRGTEQLPIIPLTVTRRAGYWSSKENQVHSIIRENGVLGPKSRKIKQALHQRGTSLTKLLGAYIPIGERSLLPFVLQLSIQTGINPTSLATLTRDCIQDFALPQYKKLVYDKPRAKSKRAKSQLIPASSGDSLAGPLKLIEFVLEWTQPLVALAPDSLKNHLFLFRGEQGHLGKIRVKTISKYDLFHSSWKKFTSDHRELPKFTLKELRPAAATYLYLTTHDVYRVRRFLGHGHVRTTVDYIRGRILADEFDASMATGIERMIDRLLPRTSRVVRKDKRSLPILATVVESVPHTELSLTNEPSELRKTDIDEIRKSGVMTLVARCRQPDKPPAFLNVPPGQICTSIFKCLNCPNATVLEEDLPMLLLRLRQIWAERKRFTLEGWQILYGEAWMTLNQVVRLFSRAARDRAERALEPI
jgi:hypothetical protein